jgi:hypothetical protein
MFTTTPHSTRRVRVISAAVAAGAMIAAFSFTASAASAAPTGTEPAEVTAPSITGSATVGGTLTADPGTWTSTDGSAVSFDYAWTDDTGAFLESGPEYQVDPAEAGHQIIVTVTASDATDSSSDTAMTGDIPQLDFSNVTVPVITGGTVVGDTLTSTNGTWSKTTGLTFTYDWGIGYGQSGDQTDPADPTLTHVVTNNDIGGTLAISVTASDATGSIVVGAQASAVTIPAPPAASDAGLTAANEGGVTGTQSKTVATVNVPAPAVEGDSIYVYGFSTGTPIGFFAVSAAHTISVPLGSLSKGLHKLALVNSSGALVGWLSVTAGGGLASTGVNVNAPLELGAAGLLILMGLLSVVFVTRSRRKTA